MSHDVVGTRSDPHHSISFGAFRVFTLTRAGAVPSQAASGYQPSGCQLAACRFSVQALSTAPEPCPDPEPAVTLTLPTPSNTLTRPGGVLPIRQAPGARVIGHFSKAVSRTATRSGVRAVTLIGAGIVLSLAAATRASAQVVTAPDTIQADTTKEVTHVVKKGDTLWDLAQFYLKDPFRWPEIFRRNTDVVENPHWIYPGEIIRIWGHEVRPEALARADSAGAVVSTIVTRPAPPPPQDGRTDLTVFASPLSRAAVQLGEQVVGRARAPGVRRGEIEAAPYVERRGGPAGAGRLVASVDRPAILAPTVESRYQLNDRLYIDPPRGQVARLGDRYLVYVLGRELTDVGQVIVPTGIVRVESVPPGQPALVRIVRQFGEIMLDQRLIPFGDVIIPVASTSPVAGGASGKVLYIHNEPVLPSIGHYVVISPTARSGVQLGDEFTFVDSSMGREDARPAPPVAAGIAQVVRVTPYATTAIIINHVQPTVREGIAVRLTGKMP